MKYGEYGEKEKEREDLRFEHFKYEQAFEWKKWREEIPFIQFDQDWEVKAVPPTGGAVVRYLVKEKITGDVLSIYLDCYDMLGIYGEPYWELYPCKDSDVYRCAMAETNELLDAIRESFKAEKDLDKVNKQVKEDIEKM